MMIKRFLSNFIKTNIISYDKGVMPLNLSGRTVEITLNIRVVGFFNFKKVVVQESNHNQHFDFDSWDKAILTKSEIGLVWL